MITQQPSVHGMVTTFHSHRSTEPPSAQQSPARRLLRLPGAMSLAAFARISSLLKICSRDNSRACAVQAPPTGQQHQNPRACGKVGSQVHSDLLSCCGPFGSPGGRGPRGEQLCSAHTRSCLPADLLASAGWGRRPGGDGSEESDFCAIASQRPRGGCASVLPP